MSLSVPLPLSDSADVVLNTISGLNGFLIVKNKEGDDDTVIECSVINRMDLALMFFVGFFFFNKILG